MPLLIVLAALLLASCGLGGGKPEAPAKPATDSQSQIVTDSEKADSPAEAAVLDSAAAPAPQLLLSVELAAPAVAEFAAALSDPALRTEALDMVAMLPKPNALLFRDQVLKLLEGQDEFDRHELAAWLAVEPAPARERLTAGLSEGQSECVMALVYSPMLGRELLRKVKPAAESTELANLCLDLLRSWGAAEEADADLLRALLKSDDQTVKYRRHTTRWR
jgi:hypothetical protein